MSALQDGPYMCKPAHAVKAARVIDTAGDMLIDGEHDRLAILEIIESFAVCLISADEALRQLDELEAA